MSKSNTKTNAIRRKALEYAKRRDWDNALKEFVRLAEIEQHNPNVYNELGDLHLKLGNKRDAFAAFHSAIDAYASVGLYNNAVAVCKKIIRLNANDHFVYGKLAKLRDQQGFKKEAVTYAFTYLDRMEQDQTVDPDKSRDFIVALAQAMLHAPDVVEQIVERLIEWKYTSEAGALLQQLAQACVEAGMAERVQALNTKLANMGLSVVPAPSTRAPEPDVGDAEDRGRVDIAVPENDGAVDTNDPDPVAAEDAIEGDGDRYDIEVDPVSAEDAEPAPIVEDHRIGATREGVQPAIVLDVEIDSHRYDFRPRRSSLPASRSAQVAARRRSAGSAAGEYGNIELEGVSDTVRMATTVEERETDVEAPSTGHPFGTGERESVEASSVNDAGVAAGSSTFSLGVEEDTESLEIEDAPTVGPPSRFDLERDEEVWIPKHDLPPGLARGGEKGATVTVSDIIDHFSSEVRSEVAAEDHRSHYDLGMAYLEMELFPEAIREFQSASEAATYRVRCLEMIGLCFLRLDEPQMAIKELEKGIELVDGGERESLGLRYNLGLAYEMVGDLDGARASFEEVYRVDMTFRDVRAKFHSLR